MLAQHGSIARVAPRVETAPDGTIEVNAAGFRLGVNGPEVIPDLVDEALRSYLDTHD